MGLILHTQDGGYVGKWSSCFKGERSTTASTRPHLGSLLSKKPEEQRSSKSPSFAIAREEKVK